MIQQDTVRLLRECDAGIQMGVAGINDVIGNVHSCDMKNHLAECRQAHEELGNEIRNMLETYQDTGKNPGTMAKGMSWMKINTMLMIDDSDRMVADLITDGCNMGVKSLSRYLNRYEAADEKSKDIAKRLIRLEADLVTDVRPYL